jgi:cytochrome c biogenesis protein CcdA
MSIKIIHILFITVASLFTLGFAAWVFATGRVEKWMGIVSGIAGIALVIYGVAFIRKSKKLL